MACEEQKENFDDAMVAWHKAQLTTEGARLNMESAQWSMTAALASIIACGLTVGAGPAAIPAFIACEIVATSAEQSAD